MSLRNFLKDFKISRIANDAVAGTSDVTSSVLDMQGYDSVVFIALVGDVTSGSVITLTAKENSTNSTSGASPITNGATGAVTAGATDTDNKIFVSDIMRPDMRYVFCVLSRTIQNAVVDGIIAIQYNAKALPVTQPSDIAASVFCMNG